MKTIKIKYVDFWNGFNKETFVITKMLSKYYNIEFSNNPDFLFYSCFGTDFENYNNCVKIFLTGENVIPNFNECDYAIGFDYIDFGDRYIRDLLAGHPSISINDRSKVIPDFANRRFCNFIYSNANSGEGAVLRQEFCKKLMEYKYVDCPGKVLHNMDTDELEPRNGDWNKSKIDFLKKYKFTIAFENSLSNGYTTEKLIHPLQSFSVPIYYGNPLVVRDFNPKAFINCNDYDNDFDKIIKRIKYLDTHDDEYLAMLLESPMQPNFDFARDKLEKWLCNIIEKGDKPFNKDPRGWSIAPYKITINKLEKENTFLKSNVDIVKLIQNTVKIKEYLDGTDKILKNISEKQELFKRDVIIKIKKSYKKQRKYFNIILISQLFIFGLVLCLLFSL